ncbi:MAG: ATP-binding cassette domain-containing protein [Bacteroidota bacterium]|nr:ATP-binding cassette domain-containing protein [Candidatus Kapabacteria bacterium]MCS7302224.1 ATP-binding cassette domain-containing protein [Candidatus Kapabacteria bacterium]MCX7937534.1 ATP-binding cassette domain-containing protein [Chlorobiota bacterium]MDW8074844.1 ATP-binding cassette domain-containing protein [Bacteroidota bacterium]
MQDVVVEVCGLTKFYRNQAVVSDVTFRIGRGEIVGLLGANGAGKSTTLRAMVGLVKPSRGQVRLFGKLLEPSLLRFVGALIERADLYPYLTAAEHIGLVSQLKGLKPTKAAMEQLLERVGLASVAHQHVRTYSYGMKQRLGLALTLVGEPELIILDEPLNGLDPEGIADTRRLITELQQEGRTVIVSSHLLAEVEQVATHLLVLHKGKLIAEGKIEQVLASYGTTTIIEAEHSAAELCALLEPVCSAVQVRSNAIRVASADVPLVVMRLANAGVRVTAVIPERSLEQFYFAATCQQ